MKFAVEHCLNGLSTAQVAIGDRRHFIRMHPPVPDLLWQNQHHWPVAALAQTVTPDNLPIEQVQRSKSVEHLDCATLPARLMLANAHLLRKC